MLSEHGTCHEVNVPPIWTKKVRALFRVPAIAQRQLVKGRQRVIIGMVLRHPREVHLMKLATDICRLPITVSACTR